MKDAEVIILSARVVGHGREIAYEVVLEADEGPVGRVDTPSFFIDGVRCPSAWGLFPPTKCELY